MKYTYEQIMNAIDIERHEELMCAMECKRLMKRTLNPIRKLKCYSDAQRFMAHIFGIDLVRRKLEKALKES